MLSVGMQRVARMAYTPAFRNNTGKGSFSNMSTASVSRARSQQLHSKTRQPSGKGQHPPATLAELEELADLLEILRGCTSRVAQELIVLEQQATLVRQMLTLVKQGREKEAYRDLQLLPVLHDMALKELLSACKFKIRIDAELPIPRCDLDPQHVACWGPPAIASGKLGNVRAEELVVVFGDEDGTLLNKGVQLPMQLTTIHHRRAAVLSLAAQPKAYAFFCSCFRYVYNGEEVCTEAGAVLSSDAAEVCESETQMGLHESVESTSTAKLAAE